MTSQCLSKIKVFYTTFFIAFAITVNADTVYQTAADLNVRSGPGLNYNTLSVIKKGESVSVIEETNSYWFKIEYNEQNAYVLSKFLNTVLIENS